MLTSLSGKLLRLDSITGFAVPSDPNLTGVHVSLSLSRTSLATRRR